jgi:hypothetical protein
MRRIVEPPDAARNPFRHPTIIDLDKLFVARRLLFQDNLKAVRGVCDALFVEIQNDLGINAGQVFLSGADIKALNYRL